ncbi:MAG: agmatine deiminase family protein [Desulfobacterales bacterium]|nr:agmatine deiminase family protein [Desulfobacterales bacterium]
MTTPRKEGFYMPAEWKPHTATWMAWPGLVEAYEYAPQGREVAFKMAKKAYSEVAKAIARFEPVNMVAKKADVEEVKQLCGSGINVVEAELDDGWFRDSGPSFVINKTGEVAGVNWVFNGWGNKYTHEYDAKVAGEILDKFGIKRFDCPMTLEGGGIHVDGEGTLLVTENCQLNKNRNPDLSKAQVEDYLREYLNVEKIIWLNGDIPIDETDGHIDGLACFIRPGVVMASTPTDKNHPDYDVLMENLETLRNSTDAKGRKIEVVEMISPCKILENGEIFEGCFMNFYIANGGVIIPAYNFPEEDKIAFEIFKKEFPDHEIVQIDTEVLLHGGGNIHCITQQQPKPLT